MRPKSPRKTIQLYWHATQGYHGWLALHLGTVALATLLQSVMVPFLLAQGVRALPGYLAQPAGSFWEAFGQIITWYLLAQAGGWVCWRTSGLAVVKLELGVMARLEERNFAHLATMSYRFFTSSFTGSLVNQANRFVSSFERLYDSLAFDIMTLLIKVLVSFAIMMTFAPFVALGMIGFFAVYVTLAIWMAMRKMPASAAASASSTRLTGRLADNLTNISAIKYFAREADEAKGFGHIVHDKKRLYTRDWSLQEFINALQAILLISFESAAFIISLLLVTRRQIDLGQFILIQAYVWNIFGSLWNVGRIARNIERSLADAAEMTQILLTQPEVVDRPAAQFVRVTAGAVSFRDVTFTYQEGGKTTAQPVFAGLNLEVQPGEKIGLVGTSGGGKTTITKLLLRLMDIDSGAILLDGHNIADMRQTDVRRAISYVPQEPLLFHRSLRDNIAYGRPAARLADIKQAAARAHAAEFIERLPEGYDTLVGERGVKLSGGQRQRVAIARAMLKDAPILMLDEATSALDSESEKLIQDALWKLMEGRTAIVIAHRLSTIQRLDRIVVLERGQIVEQGTHAELLALGGVYAGLWSHQSGGFIDETAP